MRERIRRNVGLGMAVILLVSSLGVPPASAGTVREGKSLAEAEMDVRSGPVEYNGSEQKPKVSIHLDGVPLREGVDYRLSYADNLDAGTCWDRCGDGNRDRRVPRQPGGKVYHSAQNSICAGASNRSGLSEGI